MEYCRKCGRRLRLISQDESSMKYFGCPNCGIPYHVTPRPVKPDILKRDMELEMMLLYRVDNLEEQRGIWRTWDGQWKPVFDDILPNGVSKDLPMGDSEIYKGGWFASCENLETLFKWVSPEDMITLQRHGFRVTTWDVDIKDTKRLNDLETIFLKQKATLVGWYDFDEDYLKSITKIQ